MLLLDTDIMIEILRKSPRAILWLQSISTSALGIPGFVVMELIQGARNRADQRMIVQYLRPFQVYWPSQSDCHNALQDFAAFHLSHNLGMIDCLIAHTVIGMNADLASFNLRHYQLIPNLRLIQPYKR